MGATKELLWLKRVMLTKVICVFSLWATALVAPPLLLNLFALEMPADPLFLRLFGALQTSLGVAYWFAYRDPVKNIDLIKVCIFENGLVALTIVGVGLTSGISSWFIWLSAGIAGLFCLAVATLYSKVKKQM